MKFAVFVIWMCIVRLAVLCFRCIEIILHAFHQAWTLFNIGTLMVQCVAQLVVFGPIMQGPSHALLAKLCAW